MSRSYVERTRRGIEVLQRTGELRLGEVTEDFVWDMSTMEGWPEQPHYRGEDGARQFIDDWRSAFDDWALELQELIDAGDEVVAVFRQRGTAGGSGMAVEMPVSQVWTFRDGRLARMRMYASRDQALAAVGMAST